MVDRPERATDIGVGRGGEEIGRRRGHAALARRDGHALACVVDRHRPGARPTQGKIASRRGCRRAPPHHPDTVPGNRKRGHAAADGNGVGPKRAQVTLTIEPRRRRGRRRSAAQHDRARRRRSATRCRRRSRSCAGTRPRSLRRRRSRRPVRCRLHAITATPASEASRWVFVADEAARATGLRRSGGDLTAGTYSPARSHRLDHLSRAASI